MPGADTDTGEAAQSVSEAENTPAAPLIDYDSDPSLDNSNAATPVASNASATNPRGAGTKRKKGHQAITSRSVASLTPEQLEKKRKNDREAQRAIRERTKNHIDTLNDKIRSYEQSQPIQELSNAIRAREKVQEENDELKKKMSQVISLLQPFASSAVLTSGVNGRDGESSAHTERQVSSSQIAAAGLPPMQMHNGEYIEPAMIPSIKSPLAYIASPGSQGTYSRGYVTPVIANAQVRSWPSPALSVGHPMRSADEEMPFQHGDGRLERGYVLNNTNTAFVRQPYLVSPQLIPQAAVTPPIHSMLTRVFHNCHLDGVTLRFIADTQEMHKRGKPLSELEGPPQPSYNHFLNPQTNHRPHELSKMLMGVLNAFPDLSRLPEQLAVIHMLHKLMRWQIRPTKENYDAMPDWFQPRPAQLFIPHPHWLDFIPWPRLRDACVQTIPYVSFEDFFVPYTKTYSINWPHGPEHCLMFAPPSFSRPGPTSHHSPPAAASSPYTNTRNTSISGCMNTNGVPMAPPPALPPFPTGITAANSGVPQRHPQSPGLLQTEEEPQMILTPAFEAHIMDISNWSLGKMFLETFPQWAGLWRLKD